MTHALALVRAGVIVICAAGLARAGRDKSRKAARAGATSSRSDRPQGGASGRAVFLVGSRLVSTTVHAPGIAEATAVAIARGMHQHLAGIGGGARITPGTSAWMPRKPRYDSFPAVEIVIGDARYQAHLVREAAYVGGRVPAAPDEAARVFLEDGQGQYLGPFQVAHEPTGIPAAH